MTAIWICPLCKVGHMESQREAHLRDHEAFLLESDPFVCPRCGAVSHNLNDKRNGYCGRGHDWTAPRQFAG